MCAAPVPCEELGEPGQQKARIVDQAGGSTRPARASGCAPIGPGPTSSSSRKIFGAQRRDGVQEASIGHAVANSAPRRIDPGGHLRMAPARAFTTRSASVGRLERRVDQDAAAPLLLVPQIGVAAHIPVRADDAEAAIAPKSGEGPKTSRVLPDWPRRARSGPARDRAWAIAGDGYDAARPSGPRGGPIALHDTG